MNTDTERLYSDDRSPLCQKCGGQGCIWCEGPNDERNQAILTQRQRTTWRWLLDTEAVRRLLMEDADE